MDDERRLNRRASPRRLGATHRCESHPDLPGAPPAGPFPRWPTVLRHQVEPPPPQSTYSTTIPDLHLASSSMFVQPPTSITTTQNQLVSWLPSRTLAYLLSRSRCLARIPPPIPPRSSGPLFHLPSLPLGLSLPSFSPRKSIVFHPHTHSLSHGRFWRFIAGQQALKRREG